MRLTRRRLRHLLLPLPALLALGVWGARTGDRRLPPFPPPPPHPRLLLDAADLPRLRAELTTTRQRSWQPVAQWLSAHVDAVPPPALTGDFRRVGEVIPYAALGARLADDPAALALARRYMRAVCDYPNWGDDRDIEAAHLLVGLALGYDWLWPLLPEAERRAAADKLRLQGGRMRPLCGQRHPPLNNHAQVCLAALGLAGLALHGEEPEAGEWIRHAQRQLAANLDRHGRDGSSAEGVSYWSYTTQVVLLFAAASDALAGSRLERHAWLQQAAQWPLQLSLPRDAWSATNGFVNLADSPRFCRYGPHPQLHRLAALTRDPAAQWLADALLDSGASCGRADWLSVLWYDPAVPAHPPGDEARTRVFADRGTAVMRSDWGGAAVLCTFSCGAAGGPRAGRSRWSVSPGGGHAHPDANAFTLFADGAWLAADGGAARLKLTASHNTVLVDGLGQVGEGGRWFGHRAQWRLRRPPRLVHHAALAGGDYLVGDASGAYAPAAGLQRFLRHFVFLRPRTWVIVDELEADHAARFDWLLHTPGAVELDAAAARATVREGRGVLQVQVLRPTGASLSAAAETLPQEYPDVDWPALQTLRVTPAEPARRQLLAVVLHAAAPGAPPPARLEETAERCLKELGF